MPPTMATATTAAKRRMQHSALKVHPAAEILRSAARGHKAGIVAAEPRRTAMPEDRLRLRRGGAISGRPQPKDDRDLPQPLPRPAHPRRLAHRVRVRARCGVPGPSSDDRGAHRTHRHISRPPRAHRTRQRGTHCPRLREGEYALHLQPQPPGVRRGVLRRRAARRHQYDGQSALRRRRARQATHGLRRDHRRHRAASR